MLKNENMLKKSIRVSLLGVIITVGFGFILQQGQQSPSKKPKWEELTPEEAQKVLKQHPELLSSDEPYAVFMVRISKVGLIGVWREDVRHPEAKRRAKALRSATPDVLSAETAIPVILPLLEDEVATVRFEAATALLRFGSSQGVGVLIELLKEKGDSPTSEVISVLTRYQRREAIPLLRELLEKAIEQMRAGKDDEYPAGYITSLAGAVAAFHDRESYLLFERYLGFRLSNGFRPGDVFVVEAAGRLAEPQLAGPLREVLNRSNDLRVKLSAAFGLAKVGEETALAFLMEQATLLRGMPEVAIIQEDSEGKPISANNPAYTRWAAERPPIEGLFPAIEYLGELKAAQAFPLLAEIATAENRSLVRAAVKSLALLGDKRAVPVLVKLTDPNHPLRYEAARALVFFDDPEAEQAVRRLYPNEESRAKLIKEAKELGPAEFLRP